MKALLFAVLILALATSCSKNGGDTAENSNVSSPPPPAQQALVTNTPPVPPAFTPPPMVNIPGAPPLAGSRQMPGAQSGPIGGVGAPQMPGAPNDAEWRAQHSQEDIQRSDKNNDGTLSEEEYLARYIERHKKRFTRIDRDGNGQLTARELAEIDDQPRIPALPQLPLPPAPPPATP